MQLLMRILIKGNHLAKQAFIKQLPMVIINKILHHVISLKSNTMIIINQLLRFYTLLYLRVECFVSRVLFIVNLVIFLLLMILSYTVFPVLSKRYSYSAIVCSLGKFSSLKMPVSLIQYRGTVGILNNRLFVHALMYNNFSLISHSQDYCFLDCDFYNNGIRLHSF